MTLLFLGGPGYVREALLPNHHVKSSYDEDEWLNQATASQLWMDDANCLGLRRCPTASDGPWMAGKCCRVVLASV